MARIRTIKPEFWTSEQIVDCSPTARLLFIGLWNFCDDQGVHPYSPKTIKMEVFPGDEFTLKQIEKWLDELISAELIKTYQFDNKKYLWVTGWHHQKIEKPNKKHPKPDKFDDHSTTNRQPIDDHSTPEGSLRERKGKESIGKKQKTPLPQNFEISEAVKKWAAKKGYTDLGEHHESFISKCKAKGYQYIDWDAAFMEAIRSNWAKIEGNNGNKSPFSTPQRNKEFNYKRHTCGAEYEGELIDGKYCPNCLPSRKSPDEVRALYSKIG